MTLKDTLQKLSTRLTQEEQKRQAAQFAGLGAVAVPTVSAIRNLVTEGRVIPPGVKPFRWGAGQLATGAMLFGALPAARHLIERESQEGAEERLRRKRISKGLKQYYSTAQGAPMTQVKTSAMNLTGRDNRTPFVGGTQFPTEGSKSFPRKLHQQSAGKAEVGPAPLMGELDKTKMVPLASITPKMPSAQGSLPKIGAAGFTFAPGMDTPKNRRMVQMMQMMRQARKAHPGASQFTLGGGRLSPSTPAMRPPTAKPPGIPKVGGVMDNRFANDPLVKYLKKYAQALETNVEALATQVLEPPMQSKDSDFQDTPAEKKKREEEEQLKKLFTHYPTEKLQK